MSFENHGSYTAATQYDYAEPVNPMAAATMTPAPGPIDLSPHMSARAAPDLSAGVGRAVVLSYGGLMAALALVFARGGESNFMVAVSALFLAMYVSVPALFLAIERRRKTAERARPVASGIDTETGHMPLGAVLAQMLSVPILLTFGVLAFGVIASRAF